MARRVGQPEHIRAEIGLRASAGIGLDPNFPTEIGHNRVVPAKEARKSAPSRAMLTLVKDVTGFLHEQGAQHVDVVADLRRTGEPGGLTVRWGGGVPPKKVAEAFAVATSDEGTPLIPGWLFLRADDEFDLRWQPPY